MKENYFLTNYTLRCFLKNVIMIFKSIIITIFVFVLVIQIRAQTEHTLLQRVKMVPSCLF